MFPSLLTLCLLAAPSPSLRIGPTVGWVDGAQQDGGPGFGLAGLGLLGVTAEVRLEHSAWSGELVGVHRRFRLRDELNAATAGVSVSRGELLGMALLHLGRMQLELGPVLGLAQLLALRPSGIGGLTPLRATGIAFGAGARASTRLTSRVTVDLAAQGSVWTPVASAVRADPSGLLRVGVGGEVELLRRAGMTLLVWTRLSHQREVLSLRDVSGAGVTSTMSLTELGVGLGVQKSAPKPAAAPVHPLAVPPVAVATVPVTGRVSSAAYSSALAAKLRLTPGPIEVETAQDGSFTLQVPAGTYQLLVTAAGHVPLVRTVRVREGEPQRLELTLPPAP